MTSVEFAEKVNTAYPTVAKWLREGKVPGAFRQKIGNMEIWLIPGDVLKDFERPKMGRPKKASEQSKTGKAAKVTKAGKTAKKAAKK